MVNARNVQDPVELFDLHISHIGINAATDEEVEGIVGPHGPEARGIRPHLGLCGNPR